MNYQAGEIVLMRFPYTSGPQSKIRPALVILDTGDQDVVVARITSRPAVVNSDYDVIDWKGAKLRSPATIGIHKLFTLEKSLVLRSIRQLQPSDHQAVSQILKQLFGNW